ncbi:MAG: ABC transporter permease [Chloroflexi bacterium]|nr:ABC transporter permease [Chloroflexota bacterium]
MTRFLIRRLVFIFISLIGATIVIFSLSRMAQDPRELFVPQEGYGMTEEAWIELGNKLGFDKPVPVQYLLWLGRVFRGDLGKSLLRSEPVTRIIGQRIGATVQLAIGGWIFALMLGVPLGVLAAVKRGQVWDYFGRGVALFGQGLPAFWVGIMLILLFAVILEWLPAGTRPKDFDIRYFILPCITLGWPAAAGLMRLTRSAMLEVLDSEYIKLARAKGVSNRKIIWKHALRNSLIPPVTSALLLMAGYLNGALVVEIVFSWPGIGWVALNQAVYNNDFPLLLGSVFVFMLIYVTFAFLADMAYAFIDPRIRYS